MAKAGQKTPYPRRGRNTSGGYYRHRTGVMRTSEKTPSKHFDEQRLEGITQRFAAGLSCCLTIFCIGLMGASIA